MDSLEKRLREEVEFWEAQIEIAEKRQDQEALARLREALAFVHFRLKRYQGPDPDDG